MMLTVGNSLKTLGLKTLGTAALLSSPACAERHVVLFNEKQPLSLVVSNSSLNRFSAKGDRIQEVVGLDEVVTVDRSDQHGHLFLRFPEGFTKRQDITIITEGGLVQDVSLTPIDKKASSVIFQKEGDQQENQKPSSVSGGSSASFDSPTHASLPVTGPNTPFLETIIGLMKTLYRGAGSSPEKVIEARYTDSGLGTKVIRVYTQGGLEGTVHEISNGKDKSICVLEKDFYRLGDLALAVGKKDLGPGEKTLLFVIRKAV